MPANEHGTGSGNVNTLIFQMLGDLQRAVEKLDERVQTIQVSRASEQGFKTGATWLAKVIWSCLGGLLLLIVQAVLKHFGWL